MKGDQRNGHDTCTQNISHTNCMIRFPIVTQINTTGSVAAITST
jgi:hypothetical protein